MFTETRQLRFVPGNVLSESDMYLFYSTAINIDHKKIILTSAIFYAPYIWPTTVHVYTYVNKKPNNFTPQLGNDISQILQNQSLSVVCPSETFSGPFFVHDISPGLLLE